MVNDELTCQEPFCDGSMVKSGERKFSATTAGEHDSVDVYACTECGAEDWGD